MIQSVFTVLKGSVVAQLLGFLILPLLSRSFSSEAFGHLQLYQSFVMIIGVFATLRYEIAILRAEPGRELAAILQICGGITLAFALLSVIGVGGVALFAPQIMATVGIAWWVFPVAILVVGVPQIIGYLVVREQAFAISANAKIAQATIYAGGASGLALLAPFSLGLIVADLVGRVANTAWLLPWLRRVAPGNLLKPSVVDVRAALYRFREFPYVSVLGTLINVLGIALTPMLIYGVFNASAAGQFGLVERAAGLPVALVVMAVSQVYTAQLAALLREESDGIVLHYRSMVKWLAMIVILPGIAASWLGPMLFEVVFGPGWELASGFAQFLIPAYMVTFIGGGVNMTLTVIGEQRMQMAWEVSRLIAMLVLWIAGPKMGMGLMELVAAHAGIMALSSVAFLILAHRRLLAHELRTQRARNHI